MVAAIVHLVAPQANIMPLKSFYADGTGYNSDILRAIYYATNHGAKVINMSFNYTSYSPELEKAVNYATQSGVVCVAAAGNSGLKATVYPAALKNVTYGAQVSTQSSTSLLGISLSLTSSTTVSSKTQAANALSHAQWISAPQLGYGRLDTYQAEQAWRNNLGLQ